MNLSQWQVENPFLKSQRMIIFRRSMPLHDKTKLLTIVVDTQPLLPSSEPIEVYRSNEPIKIPANSVKEVTVYYNNSPAMNAVSELEGWPSGLAIVETIYYGWGATIKIENTTSDEIEATLLVQANPLTVQNKERAVARDEISIVENGTLRYEFGNPLVQTLTRHKRLPTFC